MSTYEIVSTIIVIASIAINVFQFRQRKPKLKIQLCRSIEPNKDGVGNYLCERIFISNHGSETAIYNGLEAVDDEGSLFFPCCSLTIPSEISPNSSIVGTIPNGHLLCYGTKKLYVIDGTLSKHRVSAKVLKFAVTDLAKERDRLEKLGINVHPNNSWSSKSHA
ncbi:TPA: peptidase T [Photobacterium damselae]